MRCADAIASSVVKTDPALLQDDGRAGEQVLAGGVAHVRPAQAHAAGLHVPEAGGQAHEGGLAAARGADDGGDRPGPQLQVHVVEDERIARPVAEEDVIEDDAHAAVGVAPHRDGGGRLGQDRLGQQLPDAPGGILRMR